jgi:CubicO group peptidase (beta-lactamase class C family)
MRKLACLLLVLAPTLAAQRRATPAGWDPFVRAFDGYAQGDSIVGASVLVLKDGRVLARHEYGFGDRALGQRTDSNTIYHWASITKTLTAIAVMQLRDRGRLALDDRVTQWIPELRQIHDPYGSIDSVTIRMLLSHAAGFQNPTWLWRAGRPWEPFEPTRWEQLVAMMPYEEITFPPGARFSYSNPGFIYLARVIEALSGDPWETYIQKNILTPLGLTRSYFGATPYHLAPYRSNNYTVVRDSAAGRDSVAANGRDFDPGITIPNGGWNAPLGDLAAYLTFLTRATRGDSALARRYDTVLSHHSLDEMWHARYRSDDTGQAADSIGLSFFVVWRGARRFIGHTGHQAGFRSFFYIDPATGAGVVAAFNTASDAHEGISEAGFAAIRDSALAVLVKF